MISLNKNCIALITSTSLLLSGCAINSSSDTSEYMAYQQWLPLKQVENSWYQDASKMLQHKMQNPVLKNSSFKAKNVILFVGDGMGVSTVSAARILQGQLAGKSGEENLLSFEHFPFSGFSSRARQTVCSAGRPRPAS